MPLPSHYSFERTQAGLLFQDAFTQSDGSLIDRSGWQTGGSFNQNQVKLQIIDNEVSSGTFSFDERREMRVSTTTSAVTNRDEMVVQAIGSFNGPNTGVLVKPTIWALARAEEGVDLIGWSFWRNQDGTGQVELIAIEDGSLNILQDPKVAGFVAGTNYRMKLWASSSQSFQRAWVGSGNNFLPMSSNWTGSDSTDPGTAAIGKRIVGGGHFANDYAVLDDFSVYSTNYVTVTGIPSGYRVKIGSQISAADGSVATLDLSGTFCPAAAISLISSEGEPPSVSSTFTTNVWGGDVFNISVVTTNKPGDWERPIRNEPGAWGMLEVGSPPTLPDNVDFRMKVRSQYAHRLDIEKPLKLHESAHSWP